jgi:hypothetical protein
MRSVARHAAGFQKQHHHHRGAEQRVSLQSIFGGGQSVLNRGTNPLRVFPPLSTEIEDYGLNVATAMSVGNEATFLSDGIGTWYFFEEQL